MTTNDESLRDPNPKSNSVYANEIIIIIIIVISFHRRVVGFVPGVISVLTRPPRRRDDDVDDLVQRRSQSGVVVNFVDDGGAQFGGVGGESGVCLRRRCQAEDGVQEFGIGNLNLISARKRSADRQQKREQIPTENVTRCFTQHMMAQ